MQPYRPAFKKKRRIVSKKPGEDKFVARLNCGLASVLKNIGQPQEREFVPDPFQLHALEKLATNDVLVSAPTGSGKTWIAEQAIRHFLASNQRVWYASPLKALSNAKIIEFGQLFGEEQVGILTGDRKENSQAPLIVGTTEILRNQLYDAMHYGRDLPISLVILDEAHYLGDPERGVVWEEVMIYLPSRVKLLMLSATIANDEQITAWLAGIRHTPSQVVRRLERPVPLFPLFLTPDGQLMPLKTQKGGLFPLARNYDQKTARPQPPKLEHTLQALQEFNLLPAIFFLKSRADCEQALLLAAQAGLSICPQQARALQEVVDEFLTRFPFLASQAGLPLLLRSHIAAHHAGLLPHWKLLVETLMQKGLLKALFSTSTVAAGVNFPARTVVIGQSDRFNGRDFSKLSAGELAQMTGRAGRRGMDNIGFCLLLPGPYQDLPFMARLFDARPDPIKSQLQINFSMVLNLLLSHKPQGIRQLLALSLAAWQKKKGNKQNRAGQPNHIAFKKELDGALCFSPEEVYVRSRRLRALLSQMEQLKNSDRISLNKLGLQYALKRGRVVMSQKLLPYAVLSSEMNLPHPGVWGLGLLPERRLQRGQPRIDFIPLDEILKVFSQILALPASDQHRALANFVMDCPMEPYNELNGEQLTRLGQKARQKINQQLHKAQARLDLLLCATCPMLSTCANRHSALVNQVEKSVPDIISHDDAWFEFVRHLEFLRSEKFVDALDQLTSDGLWTSSLRLNQPILIAQCIRQGAFPLRQPALLAALLALFVDDREPREGNRDIPPQLNTACAQTLDAIQPLLERLRQWGFNLPPMPLTSAGAVFAWAQNMDMEQVSAIYGGGEGDVAQLVYRVTDNLRQLAGLKDTHPQLAASCWRAIDLLLRPPILIPS